MAGPKCLIRDFTNLNRIYKAHGQMSDESWKFFGYTYKVWYEITYPFPNFNSCTVEVQEWLSNSSRTLCQSDNFILVHYDWMMSMVFNSLGPSDAIWHWRSWSTLVQVIACCLTAPSRHLNQCWLIISKVQWHSSEDIIIRRFEDTNQ